MSKKYIQELISMSDDDLALELDDVGARDFREALKLALKEQDRDTRHACAEAVIGCGWAGVGSLDNIDRDDAHSACMNITSPFL